MLLVRHPRPLVSPGLCYGSTDLAALPADTARVHAALREAQLPGQRPVYASPLRRCADLAQRLAGSAVRFDARLAEMDFGAWEMRSWEAIGRAPVEAWNGDLLHYRPGGGENLLQVAHRVARFRAALYGAGHADALVICHAGSMRLLAALHTGLGPEAAALHAAGTPHQLAYGEMLVLDD